MIKHLASIFLALCLALTSVVCLADEEIAPVMYIFGDDWAKAWGDELLNYALGENRIVNAAQKGDLLSQLEKKALYSQINSNDSVILSYGMMAQGYTSDTPADFTKALESVVSDLKKRGVNVFFVSVCSTRRQNQLTGNFEETRNFYTEEMKKSAKNNGIEYIDLAAFSAEKTREAGAVGSMNIYASDAVLTKNGERMCAIYIVRELCKNEDNKQFLSDRLSIYYTPVPGEKEVLFDVFAQSIFCQSFNVYIKGGKSVLVNNQAVADGDSETVTRPSDGKIKLTFSSAKEIQIAPNYEYNAMDFSTENEPYIIEVADGTYNISVRKTEPLKASVYADGYLIVSNLDMPGTEEVETPSMGTFRNFESSNGKIGLTVKGLTDKISFVRISESAEIFKDKARIFVAGDSTLCNYYPILRTGLEPDGTIQTGWAQLLQAYTPCEVVNLALSGDWASNWRDVTFPTVLKEGKAGDYFIIQFGINDKDKSDVTEMKEALSQMISLSAEKGIIPILVSPQISAGYGWGDASDIGMSDGGVYHDFFTAVGNVAEESGCFYVDLTALSAGWFSEIGRDAVYKKYHLWDSANEKPLDMMHLSYKGANAMCNFFVTAVKALKAKNENDKWKNSLTELTLW